MSACDIPPLDALGLPCPPGFPLPAIPPELPSKPSLPGVAIDWPAFDFGPAAPGFPLPAFPPELPTTPSLPGIALEMPTFNFAPAAPGFPLPPFPPDKPTFTCPLD